jgi:hypothetical protein
MPYPTHYASENCRKGEPIPIPLITATHSLAVGGITLLARAKARGFRACLRQGRGWGMGSVPVGHLAIEWLTGREPLAGNRSADTDNPPDNRAGRVPIAEARNRQPERLLVAV